MTPEEKARQAIDGQLVACGWVVQAKDKVNLSAAKGIAISELSFSTGEPDYTLFADAKPSAPSKPNRKAKPLPALRNNPQNIPPAFHPACPPGTIPCPSATKAALEQFATIAEDLKM
ncbi:MAG TPA: hypothetical protein VME24_04880 [Alphaproteobacteria bacterium]|nr:hypothetical protein [Alphaproteobacteria bacterium]